MKWENVVCERFLFLFLFNVSLLTSHFSLLTSYYRRMKIRLLLKPVPALLLTLQPQLQLQQKMRLGKRKKLQLQKLLLLQKKRKHVLKNKRHWQRKKQQKLLLQQLQQHARQQHKPEQRPMRQLHRQKPMRLLLRKQLRQLLTHRHLQKRPSSLQIKHWTKHRTNCLVLRRKQRTHRTVVKCGGWIVNGRRQRNTCRKSKLHAWN